MVGRPGGAEHVYVKGVGGRARHEPAGRDEVDGSVISRAQGLPV